MQVLSFTQNSRDELRLLGGDGEVAASIMAESGTHQSTYVAVLGVKRRRRETWAWDTKYSSSRHGCFKGNREFIDNIARKPKPLGLGGIAKSFIMKKV